MDVTEIAVRTRKGKAIFVVLVVVMILFSTFLVFEAVKPPKHAETKISFLQHNDQGEPVCLVTFSNASDAMFIAWPGLTVDYLANGIWTRTNHPEPGAIPGPFWPGHGYQYRISVPRGATGIRVASYYEHLPKLLENTASVPSGWSSWRLWTWMAAISKTKIETNWSNTIAIEPFTNSTPNTN